MCTQIPHYTCTATDQSPTASSMTITKTEPDENNERCTQNSYLLTSTSNIQGCEHQTTKMFKSKRPERNLYMCKHHSSMVFARVYVLVCVCVCVCDACVYVCMCVHICVRVYHACIRVCVSATDSGKRNNNRTQ